MHEHLLLGDEAEERELRQPREGLAGGGDEGFVWHGAMQRVGHAGHGNGQVGGGGLEQGGAVAVVVGEGEEGVQQHVAGAQLQGEGEGFVQIGRRGGDVYAQGLRLAFQADGDVGQAGAALVQHGVQVFEHARVATDAQEQGLQGAGERRVAVFGLQLGEQAGQAQDELAGLGVAEGAEGQGLQPGREVHRGVAAGEEQAPAAGRFAQLGEHLLVEGLPEAGARGVGLQVVFEVVEDDEQALFGQGGADEFDALLIVVGAEAGGEGLPLLMFALAGGAGDGVGQPADVEGAGERDTQPAFFREPGHDAAGEAALAHPAHALQDHAGPLAKRGDGGRVAAQDAQGAAQLDAPADQVAQFELGHREAAGLMNRGLAQGVLVEAAVEQGLFEAGAEQGRGGVLGRRGAAGLGAPGFEFSPGQGQGAAGGGAFGRAQGAVEGSG